MAKADTIIEVIKNSTVIPSKQFLPFIKQISVIFGQATELYKTAQHNQNIAKILTERIIAANSFVNILYLREDIFNSYYYISLQRLVQVLINMKNYIEEITQYNTVQKFLEPEMIKMIEKKFKDLCKEYDSSINVLNFNLPVSSVKFNAQEEQKILKDDVTELLKFQEALIESIDGKISDANVHMSVVIEQVSEVSQIMQTLMDDKKDIDQTKIDNIFQETPLPFGDYRETEDGYRTENLRKYIHVKTLEEFAFKKLKEYYITQVKNQVTILKKLKNCQNIIRFYGLTNDGSKNYIVTEWAENKNLREYISERGQDIEIKLRIRIAYDIAKGLNFLNSVNVIFFFLSIDRSSRYFVRKYRNYGSRCRKNYKF
ncbi:hypothetical protein C1645_27432 [Glomus cerebriforme]|uniref:Protein kinase domain-containing protein n=1 Tax=Glomus cerebriforme TaxID=658196 RepID=A0A397T5S6_9GLOM|nr:hypothetical protein C1645_27432 [Glomus cerebriforme]